MLWSRHVKPSSAKGEKRQKRKKIPKFVQAEALPESEIMYKSKDRCTGMKDRITRDREIQRYAKTYQKPSPQTSVHLEQQVELRKKVESGSTIADSEAAQQVHLSCAFFFWFCAWSKPQRHLQAT